MSTTGGAKTWYFPDGYLPEKDGGPVDAHEAIMILNTQKQDVTVLIDIYFDDKNPICDIEIPVAGQRVVSLHTDIPEHIGGVIIPALTQYAIRLRCDSPIVAQFGRLDTTQANMAYYCAPAIYE